MAELGFLAAHSKFERACIVSAGRGPVLSPRNGGLGPAHPAWAHAPLLEKHFPLKRSPEAAAVAMGKGRGGGCGSGHGGDVFVFFFLFFLNILLSVFAE